MSESLISERACFLEMFDEYIRKNIDDEELFDYWLERGVPDGADVEMLREIAEDEDSWIGCVRAFKICCEIAGVLAQDAFFGAALMTLQRGIFHYTTSSAFCQPKMLHKNRGCDSHNFVYNLPKVMLDFFAYRVYNKYVR